MTELIDLLQTPRWCAWRNERRGDKVIKVPYSGSDREAKSDDPTTWQPHDAAAVVAENILNGHGGGVGFMLGEMDCVFRRMPAGHSDAKQPVIPTQASP